MSSLQIETSTSRLAQGASVVQLAWNGLSSFVLPSSGVSSPRKLSPKKKVLRYKVQTPVRTMRTFAPSTLTLREPFYALPEVIMAALAASNRPWSRRLIKLDAQKRLHAHDLVTFVSVLLVSDESRWPTPGVFPGEDSGIRAEWHLGRRHAIFEIDDDGDMYAYYFDLEAKTSELAEPKTQQEAVEFLRTNLA